MMKRLGRDIHDPRLTKREEKGFDSFLPFVSCKKLCVGKIVFPRGNALLTLDGIFNIIERKNNAQSWRKDTNKGKKRG
jgi:hypothetical protein